ncbi:MAG: LysE family translocator [Verrucomicrobiales bacterium]
MLDGEEDDRARRRGTGWRGWGAWGFRQQAYPCRRADVSGFVGSRALRLRNAGDCGRAFAGSCARIRGNCRIARKAALRAGSRLSRWKTIFCSLKILVVGQFTPVPDLLLITRNALAAERAGPALATAFGVCAGLVAHTAAAFGGFGLAVQAMPDLQAALSVAGALYLAYLGVQLVRAAWSASAHEGGGGGAGGAVPLAARKAFAQGLFTNLLNPKVLLFFTGMSARFAADATPLAAGRSRASRWR